MPDDHVGERTSLASSASRRARIANGTCRQRGGAQSTGRPSHIESARNVSGGKPVTPSFITGQFRPQATRQERQQGQVAGAEAVVETQFRLR